MENKMENNKNHKHGMHAKTMKVLALVSVFLIGVLTHFIFDHGLREHCGSGKYHFVNHKFACGRKPVLSKKSLESFRKEVEEFTEEKKRLGEASLVAVYVRDLEFGPTMAINENVDFIPASLLKLPLVLTYYDLFETDQSLKDKKITLNSKEVSVPEQTFKPRDTLISGESYTIGQLIEHSIVNSDNLAAQLLFNNLNSIDSTRMTRTYRDLGIIDVGTDLNKEVVNARGYASIFRMLYNVSYLNAEDSEEVLSILSRSEFEGGLRAGVPRDLVIAHKFGERLLENGEKQLHDCGIVYFPKNPYSICILTKGWDFQDLEKVISEISKMVYEEFESRRLK